MDTLVVRGGRPLFGSLSIHGAKNGVLPLLAATLLCKDVCEISGCPDISDLTCAKEILTYLGCRVYGTGETVTVAAACSACACIPPELSGKMRASITFLGALLARHGYAEIALPGGCVLGERPIDYHIRALRVLGVASEQKDETLLFTWKNRRGGRVVLPYPSVGATENLLLAATGVPGQVEICGAAREPEIGDLCAFLQKMGAKISGAGSSTIQIAGGKPLHGASYRVLPDRIETATYLAMTAACGGEITLQHTAPALLEPVISVLRQAGCSIHTTQNSIFLRREERLHGVGKIQTEVYPGFPTDAQAPIMAALLCSDGRSVLEDTVFPERFRHVPELQKFGADIQMRNSQATVRGVEKLFPASATATDLRGGAGVLIAALTAKGESRVNNIALLRRGYAGLEDALRTLGAEIDLT